MKQAYLIIAYNKIEQLKYAKREGHLFSRKFDFDKCPNMEKKIIEIINCE